MEQVYSLHQWADVTGQSYSFWWRLAKAGRLPCIRTDGKIFVRASAVEAWMAQQEAASVARVEQPQQYGTLRKID